MLSFFKKKNKAAQIRKEHPFYGQYILLEDQLLSVIQHTDELQQLDLKTIKWISIYNWEKTLLGFPNCWILIGSLNAAQISICTVAGNFDLLEQYLMQIPNFNLALYKQIKNADQEYAETLLFKAHQVDNFILNPSPQKASYSMQDGIYIEDRNCILPWLDYADLDLPGLQRSELTFPNPNYQALRFSLAEVQLFNGLQVSSIYTETHPRLGVVQVDRPILSYHIDFIAEDIPNAFIKLADHLDTFFELRGLRKIQDRELYYRLEQGDCTLTLEASWDSRVSDFFNPFYLSIAKKPELSRFYESDFLNQLQLSDIQVESFAFEIYTSASYLTSDQMFYTPSCFAIPAAETWFWKHQELPILGISSAEWTFILLKDEIDTLILNIENVRGREGGNFLEIGLNGKIIPAQLSISETTIFIAQMERLQLFWGITLRKEIVDNHY